MIEKAKDLSICADFVSVELEALRDHLTLIGDAMECDSKAIHRCSLYLSQIYLLISSLGRISEELSNAVGEFNRASREG